MKVATTKDVMKIFNCSQRHALTKMKIVRLTLGKRTSNEGKKGADPITVEQIIKHFGLK
jgi:hypothetical protein